MKHRSFSRCILLALGLALLMVQTASATAGVWTPTVSMIIGRCCHTATLLPDGKVLVAGGSNGISALSSAELYDPVSGTWTATSSLAVPRRWGHTATLLLDGRVLVAGGYDGSHHVIATAELYDPATGLWTSAGTMEGARAWHTATLLPLAGGKILVAGGRNAETNSLASAELYDPSTNTWTSTGSMNTVRGFHAAVRLLSAEVLVMGGVDRDSTNSAELFDPATGKWSFTGPLATGRGHHTATLLSNGTVLVVGGWHDHYLSRTTLSSAELYDPATGAWMETGSLGTARALHTATLLADGKVLVPGGVNDLEWGLSSAEVYDPATGSWSDTSSLVAGRSSHRAVLLPNGKVLAVGGENENGELASAELFTSTQILRPKSKGPQDGWALETSENSNQGSAIDATAVTFNLGDHASNRQYRSILHFNTSSLPDNAVITRVLLKVRKQSVTGTDPFTTHGKIAIDIRKGAFSGAGALQPTDFQAVASMPAAGYITNNPTASGWYSARLNAAAHPFINLKGITQFRLRFQLDDDNDAVADYIRFYSGNAAPADRPVLVVEYYVQ